MSDSETEVREQTTTEEFVEETDEVSENTDEKAEVSEQDTVEKEDTEDTSEETDDGEVWEESKYLEEAGLSEDFESIDDVMAAYKKLRDSRTETRTERPAPEDTRPRPETQKSTESYFPKSPFSDTVELLKKEGLLADADAEKSYRSIAQFSDRAFAPVMKQFEEVANFLAEGFMRQQDMWRDSDWGRYASKGKPNIKRDDLDKILNNAPVSPITGKRINTYAQAAQYYYALDPEKFDQFRRNTEQEGFKKGQQKKKKFTSNRRAKPTSDSSTSMASFNQYFDEEGKLNSMEYNRLSSKQQVDIAEKLEVLLRKQMKG